MTDTYDPNNKNRQQPGQGGQNQRPGQSTPGSMQDKNKNKDKSKDDKGGKW